jgi:hypothetical protein
VELADKDPAHRHTVILRFSDGSARTAIFDGPGWFIPTEGKEPVSARLWGKRSKRPNAGPAAAAPVAHE